MILAFISASNMSPHNVRTHWMYLHIQILAWGWFDETEKM